MGGRLLVEMASRRGCVRMLPQLRHRLIRKHKTPSQLLKLMLDTSWHAVLPLAFGNEEHVLICVSRHATASVPFEFSPTSAVRREP